MRCAIILAGGSATRMGTGVNKVFLPVGGIPAIARSLIAFQPLVDLLVCVARQEDRPQFEAILKTYQIDCLIAPGGEDRQASVYHGLCALPTKAQVVLIHDGARALVTPDIIKRVIASVETFGTGVAAVPLKDTAKQINAQGQAILTPQRESLRAVQTPQGFNVALIRKAHEDALLKGLRATDDAALVEALGIPVQLVEGSERNLKLTTPQDLKIAQALLEEGPGLMVGQGYDVHALVPGRPLVLCGVTIPHTLGLMGHSDADVALHALMDALLGAAGLYDIGHHFPDTDPAYRGISSLTLLNHVMGLLKENGLKPVNADITLIAQKPKLLGYLDDMRATIAQALSLPQSRVNVKATTTEGLGFEGREEGISAMAVCLLAKDPGGDAYEHQPAGYRP